ncbi:MAG: cupin domain-containing protein [Acidobacteriia bacterium]|nr:cupin domain-containing protein [Terriglobia bacterium]
MIETFSFERQDWAETSPGIRQKGFESDGHRFRLVEYAVDARHEEWCARGHLGYVLEGTIEFEMPDQKILVKTGEAFHVAEGTPHRARNAAAIPSRFFLAD